MITSAACHVGAGDKLLVRRPASHSVCPVVLVPLAPLRTLRRRAPAALQLLGAENQGAGGSVVGGSLHVGTCASPMRGLFAHSEPACAVRGAACVCVRATAGQGKDPVTHARHSRASRSSRAEFVAHSRPTPRTIGNQVGCARASDVRAGGPVRMRSRREQLGPTSACARKITGVCLLLCE